MKKIFYIHNVGSLSSDQCVESYEIAIDRDERVEYIALPSPLQFTHNLSLLQEVIRVEKMEVFGNQCSWINY